jgi:hypothetical protein
MAPLRSFWADNLYHLRNAGDHSSAVLHAFGVRMIGDPGCKSRKSRQTYVRSERLTLAALADRLADRPWSLAFASFALTALLFQPNYLGVV